MSDKEGTKGAGSTGGQHDRGGWMNTDKARDLREQQFDSHVTVYPDEVNEDGSITDVPAQKAAQRQHEQAGVSPLNRVAADDSVGTPAWFERNSPDHMHSDGGPTLAPEMDSVLDVYENSDQLKKDLDDQIERDVKRSEKINSGKGEDDTKKDDEKKAATPSSKPSSGDRK